MGGRGLLVQRESIGLDQDEDAEIDLLEFRRLLDAARTHPHTGDGACPECRERLLRAVDLYRGDLLEGFTLRDSSAFDDWQFTQSEALRQDLADTLDRLVEMDIRAGEMAEAIGHCRRRLSLDQLDEGTHRRLITLYAWNGQRGAAQRQYRDCIRILDQELGVPPLEETTQQYQAVRENRLGPPPSVAAPTTPMPMEEKRSGRGTRPTAQSMVGRSTELQALQDAYRTVGRDGRLLVLSGEAGIGKTRLAEEFLESVGAGGASVLSARCFRGEESMAYGPFVEALRAAVAEGTSGWPDGWLGEVGRLVPEIEVGDGESASVSPLDTPGAQMRFFEVVSLVFASVSSEALPAVLFLDDLHWADEASLDLLAFMVRRLKGKPVCILATWRDEPGGEGRLRGLLAEAERSGLATSISLGRLSRAEVSEMVLDAGLTEDMENRLFRETEGLPFFLVEYLRARGLEGEGVGEGWETPASVRDMVMSRLTAIGQVARQVLDTAAVIGRSFDFHTLQAVSGRAEVEAVEALEELVSWRLVTQLERAGADADAGYDFAHDRLRAVVYEETSAPRRRLLHRRVAETVLARSSPLGAAWLAATVAHHFRMAGQEADAALHFRVAADHARSVYANSEALHHYQSALELGHPEAAANHEAVGDMQTLLGRYADAVNSYERAASISSPDDVVAIEGKLGNVNLRSGDWAMATSHFETALAGLSETGPLGVRSRMHADLGLAAHGMGDDEGAHRNAARALELGEVAIDSAAVAQAHNILGVLARSRGDVSAALEHLGLSLSISRSLDDRSAQVAALNNLSLARSGADDIDGAIGLAESALEMCVALGDRHREAALRNNLADLLHNAGRPDAAMTQLKMAVAIFAEIGEDAGAMQPEIWKLIEW